MGGNNYPTSIGFVKKSFPDYLSFLIVKSYNFIIILDIRHKYYNYFYLNNFSTDFLMIKKIIRFIYDIESIY